MALRYALAALLVLLGTPTAAGERPLIRELARREVPLSQDYFEHPRVNLAAFDGEALHWIDEPLAAEAGCTPQAVRLRNSAWSATTTKAYRAGAARSAVNA